MKRNIGQRFFGKYIKRGRIVCRVKRLSESTTVRIIFLPFNISPFGCGKSNCLSTVKDNIVAPFTLPNQKYTRRLVFLSAYITPSNANDFRPYQKLVLKRKQYTYYRMLGNGWTVDVISDIFDHMPYNRVRK